MPMPTNEIDATASSTSAAAKFASGHLQAEEDRHHDEQRRARRMPQTTANRPMPNRCTPRASGAMNVYSMVPSQRSQATVSVMISNTIPRKELKQDRADQQDGGLALDVEARPPLASTPLAMKTIVSASATVQAKNASSQ